ncbi:MAG: GNAT family N-acetyltransferase [Micropruina sp.]|nr:GNAT family N-acetyltransferase [Micropruina sp.]
MTEKPRPQVTVRVAATEDRPAILALLGESLKWREGDPNADFFTWKHQQNPFGESPAWVALHEDRIVGFRTFVRWRFIDAGGRKLKALRAVDTATAPDFQGLGIFRRLTLQAVAELTLAGEDLIFNTPNSQSRPGYLKMGWSVARRLPIAVLPAGPGSMARMVTSRVPAAKWSEPSAVGLDAGAALADPALAEALLAHAPSRGVRTDRSPAYLAWRTALPSLAYRLLLVDEADPAAGGIIFRLRRRGEAVEAAVIELLVPDPRRQLRLLRRMLGETRADYAIALRTGPWAGLIPFPGQGPLLTTRPLASSPPAPHDWTLTLGDVELF